MKNLKNNLTLAKTFVRFYMDNGVVFSEKREPLWECLRDYLWRGTNKEKKIFAREIASAVSDNSKEIKLLARALWDIKMEQSQDLDDMIYTISRLNTWSDKVHNGNYSPDIREKFHFGTFILNSVLDELKCGKYRTNRWLHSNVTFDRAWDVFMADVKEHI